jgi:putative SOS response-associated peptidase YedK
MCGRTTLTITPDDLERTFGFPVPPGYRPRYNVAPSQDQLVIRRSGSEEGFGLLRWGLVPFWADSPAIGNRMINARAETVASKPAYRAAFAKRRCLVVVDGFYEWQATPEGKKPHRVRVRGGGPFTLAGLWERWDRGAEPVETCAIITTEAAGRIVTIHDRMPVIIPPEGRSAWLSEGTPTEELVARLAGGDVEDLEAYEVSTLVNSPANDGPDCIEPLVSPLLPE